MKRFMEKAEYKNYKIISFTSRGKELAERVLFLVSGGEFERGCDGSGLYGRGRYSSYCRYERWKTNKNRSLL